MTGYIFPGINFRKRTESRNFNFEHFISLFAAKYDELNDAMANSPMGYKNDKEMEKQKKRMDKELKQKQKDAERRKIKDEKKRIKVNNRVCF